MVATWSRSRSRVKPASVSGSRAASRRSNRSRGAASGAAAPRDLFDLLLAARDPETDAGFTRERLRDQVATMLVAGHETTAVTLFWSLYLLAGAPDIQARMA